LKELFSRDGVGTLLSASAFDQIRQATVDDLGGILELLVPLEEEGVLVRRSREKLEEEVDDYFVLIRDGAVIGCAALHLHVTERCAEVACLVVAKEYRNENRGEQLLASLEKVAKQNGIEKIFLLTTHTLHWFIEQGFSEAAIKDLPVTKQALYNVQRNSKVLIKSLK